MNKRDSQCPLGFHPQFRRPSYCKRCFREYNEHKTTGSSTSINSLSYERNDTYGSRDSLSTRGQRDDESLSRSRSDLTASTYSRATSEDEEKKYQRGSYTGARPMSWSAQDLRKAVDDAKEQVKASREDVSRLQTYGSRRSITQDLGSLGRLSSSPREKHEEKTTKEAEDTPKPSFSSYLSNKAKNTVKPFMSRSASVTEESPTNGVEKGSKYSNDTRPTRSSLKPMSDLPEIKEGPVETEDKPRKTIQSLRGNILSEIKEVKSMDADASYVIQLRPKKSKKEKPPEPKVPLPDPRVENDLLQKEKQQLNQELKDLGLKYDQLELANKELAAKKSRFGDARKQMELAKLQQKVDDLTDEVKLKDKEIATFKKDLSKKPPPLRDVEVAKFQQKVDELSAEVKAKDREIATIKKDMKKKSPSLKSTEDIIKELKSQLQASEQVCEELAEENEENKSVIRALELEMEEMQDNFREDNVDEYRELKREIEQRAKDCRVLQFKLKKAAKNTNKLESDKSDVEAKLRDLQVGESDIDIARVKILENQLIVAKEISLSLHKEMAEVKTQLQVAETDRKRLTERAHDSPMRPVTKVSRSQIVGRENSVDNSDQVYRDLQTTLEREQDTKEQLKYSEEEVKSVRKKLSRLEEENDSLQLQLNKMSTKAKRQRSMERTGSHERSNSVERGSLSRQNSGEKNFIPHNHNLNGDDFDSTDLKIQLELTEQESTVLRTKVESLETDNMRLQKELKDILSPIDTRKANSTTTGAKDNIYFSKKIRSLEQELSDQRKTIADLDKERKQLQNDLEAAKKRTKMTRTRSVEQAESENKSKIENYEKEIEIVKKKIQELEESNSKLHEENNKLLKKSRNSTASLDGLTETKTKDLEEMVARLTAEIELLKKDNDEMKSSSPYRDRVPKKPRDLTPKSTLVKWVNELENECAKLNVKLKMNETEKQVLEKMSGTSKDRKGSVDSEMCHLLFADCDTLRNENDSIKSDLEQKETDCKSLNVKIKQLETDLKKQQSQVVSNASGPTAEELANWTPPKLTDITPKSALRRMVEDLIRQCALLHGALKEKEKKMKADDSSPVELMDKLHKQKERNDELSKQLDEERSKKDSKVTLRKRATSTAREEDLKVCEGKIAELQKEVQEKKNKIEELESKPSPKVGASFDDVRAFKTEKHLLQKQLSSSQQNVELLEKKLKETEESLKTTEKSEKTIQSLLEDVERKLNDEKTSQQSVDNRQKELANSWLKEREDLKKEASDARKSREISQKELQQSQKTSKGLEERLVCEQNVTKEAETKSRIDKEKYKKLVKERDSLQVEYALVKENMNSMDREKDRLNARHLKEMDQNIRENEDLKIRMNTLESELKTTKKKFERLDQDSSIGMQGRATEILDYKERLRKIETEKSTLSSQIEALRVDSESQIKDLERSRKKESKLLQDLQKKYDLLEEDFVIQKAQLTMGNEQEFNELRRDYDVIENELKTLRETYNMHKDNWIRDKLNMQVQMNDFENRLRIDGDSGPYSERQKLINIIEDKTQQIDTLKLEADTIQDQLSYYRREADDLKKKLDDLEKLQDLADKRQNSSAEDSRGYEIKIKDLKTKLTAMEKTYKTDITKMKMRNDTKLKALTEEVTAITHHMTKYRRERDTYKEMLDGAQKNIAELKGNSVSNYRSSRADNATEAKAHLSEIHDLQGAITELEDKLADSRLGQTKMKNQIVDQKTTFEIQISEMQTKVNEYEEDRLLTGGGRRLAGLRTRLELNWQKEREEQQRLIQETATLAKDLRQTLYEVERERDMEKLEAKRKIDQLKKSVSMEHQDTKGKVQELQRDLMELREAHAKLRQINEKLRREKDRTEVEREAMRDKFLGSSRDNLNQMTKMEKLLEQMGKVKDLSPLVLGESIDGRGSSLSNLPADPTLKTRAEFTDALKRISRHAEDIKCMMGLDDMERMRRTPLFRKALSIESDEEGPSGRSRSVSKGAHRHRSRGDKSQLYRKAQSLDHQIADERSKIWASTDVGSTSSIESAKTEDLGRTRYDFDSSMDRMSIGSQTSDVDTSEPKKKGFKGMLSKFGRTKSIEDSSTAGSIFGAGMKALVPGMTGSGNSIASEPEPDKSVKSKIKTLFKKSPSSRSQSTERDTQKVQKTTSSFESDPSDSVQKSGISDVSEVSETQSNERIRHLTGLVSKAKMSIRTKSGSFETN